jgi:quercetin dioxygenase-like cupin family protein
MKPIALLLSVALLAVLPAAGRETHAMLSPQQMQWVDLAALPPGARGAVIQGPLDQPGPFTVRVRFPANYRIPPHWHPAIEHVTVLSGTFHMGMGEKFDRAATTPLGVGSVAIMPAKSPHYAWTAEATELQLHGVGPWDIVYVDPADDPRRDMHTDRVD